MAGGLVLGLTGVKCAEGALHPRCFSIKLETLRAKLFAFIYSF